MASSRKPKTEMRATFATLAFLSSYTVRPMGLLFVLALHFLFTEIPDEVLDHPTMQRLLELFIDIVVYDNVHHFLTNQTQEPKTYFPPQDMLSYQKEESGCGR